MKKIDFLKKPAALVYLGCAMGGMIGGTTAWGEPAPAGNATPYFTAGGEPETAAAHDARMKWWREAKFGLFIHWGLYSVPAGVWNGKQIGGTGEWIMHTAKIPVKDYAALAPKFNPVRFDAKSWVALAKAAGMKYVVITAKHHDGFAMYHSKVSPFNIVDATPFKKDPIRELADECRKQGLRFGLYYSQAQDWSHPGGGRRGGTAWDPAQEGDMDAYIRDISVPQVTEILKNYGPLAVLWWDTPYGMNKERAQKFLPVLKQYPNLITNDRLGGGYHGDTGTPEQYIPPGGFPNRDWETCMTMNNTWGYKSADDHWKSADQLLRNLIDIVSKGGNYLLNVGPTSEGVIPEPSVERLHAIGKWMAVNGEAIYGAKPTLFGPEAGSFSKTKKDRHGQPLFEPAWDWRCTTKPGRLYFHLFKWPGEKFETPTLYAPVTGAYLLGDKKPLKFSEHGSSVTISGLPKTAPDPMATVLCVEIGEWVGPGYSAQADTGKSAREVALKQK